MSDQRVANGKGRGDVRDGLAQTIVALFMLLGFIVYVSALLSALQAPKTPSVGAAVGATLSASGIGSADWLANFVILYAVGLVFLITGLAIFIARRRFVEARAFVLSCVAFALTAVTGFESYTPYRLMSVSLFGLAVLGGSLIHLALVYPQRTALIQSRGWSLWLPYLTSGLIAIMGVALWAQATAGDGGSFWVEMPAWRAALLYATFGALFWLVLLLHWHLRTDSPVTSAQTRVILYAVVVSGLPVLVWFVLSGLGVDLNVHPTILVVPLVLLPLSIAHAMLNQQAFDPDVLISRAVSYALLALLVLAGYVLFVYLLELLLGTSIGADHPVAVVLLILAAVFAINPLRSWLHHAVDQALHRHRIEFSHELDAFDRELRPLLHRPEIFAALADRVEAAVHPERLMFFVYDKTAAQFVLLSDSEGSSKATSFSPDGDLARLLVQQGQRIYWPDGRPPSAELEWEAQKLKIVAASVYIPLPHIGWMAMGLKRSGENYSTAELEYLEALGDQASMALERVQLITDLERRVDELNSLRWISQAINYTVGLDDLLELIYTQSKRVLGATNFYIVLYDEVKGTLSFAFYVENDERYYPSDEWPLDMAGLQGVIIRHGRPIVTDDYMSECLRRNIPPGGKADRAWMGVPLKAGDQVIGVMNTSSSEPGVRYTDDQLSLFSAIADQAAAIIHRARLDEEMTERARELATLNEVASAINSTLDLETVLHLIVEKATQILAGESGSLWLTDEHSRELVFQMAVGPGSEELVGLRLAPGTGIVGATAQTKRPIIVNDTQRDDRWFSGPDDSIGYISRAILSVPLVSRGDSIGVLQILNKKDGSSFDEQDAQLMLAFASQAAIAIDNARLFTLTDQALADRVEELSMFQRIDHALNATLNYTQVIELTLDWAMRMTRVPVGAVLSLDEEQGGLFVVASRGLSVDFDRYRESPWSVSGGLVGRAVRTGKVVVADDVSKDAEYVTAVPETQSQLVVPLRLGERVIGAITLESPKLYGFREDDVQFAVRLADRAVVPIENAQLYEQVKRANEAKSQFVSMVAHELKVPMTSIKGYARLLELGDDTLDDTKKGFIKTINANVDRMTKTVNDLLDISRIEMGRLKLEIDAVSIPDVIDESLASLGSAVEDKGLELTLGVPEDLPLVWGDRTRIVQVLINLLSNACKYTVEGSIHITAKEVELPVADNGRVRRFVSCSVRDTGIGISKEDQERLFKSQFVRFENAVDVAPGHGLGLWLVNRLAQLQGGHILVESNLGDGSTFSVAIPVADREARNSASRAVVTA